MLNRAINADQADSLRELKQKKVTKVIAVAAGKGGVGKSTVSVNLALALAQQDQRVMLFDGDLGLANIDVMLGLNARYNLSHVIDNVCQLPDIILNGPLGLKIIPSSSGIDKMVKLGSQGYAGIVNAFNYITCPLDYLIVDTAAGITDDVCSFSRSAQQVIIVVCDEPTSLTDAYALMKVLSKKHKITKFHVLANMIREPGYGRHLFSKLYRVAEQYLDITLSYLGTIPFDEYIHQAIKKQQGVVTAFPDAVGAKQFKKIAGLINAWPEENQDIDNQRFFLEKYLAYQCGTS